jgi:hypothetical protein
VREGNAGLWAKRAAIIVFFTVTLAAAGYAAYPYRDAATAWFARATATIQPPAVSPLTGFSPSAETTESAFQQAPFWRLMKQEFPAWYEQRVQEASQSAREGRPEAETRRTLMQAVLELRRKHAGDALSATAPRLISLASTFADNLVLLRQIGVDACYTYIVGGEVSPGYMAALADPTQNPPYQAQLVAMFEAVVDGRKTPRVYPQPRQSDYNQLVVLLEAKGWTERDMALYSNSQAFGQAAPDKVCRMVTDWFQAQLELKDKDAQVRLLADSLKPVVAG